jgi:uncharacterized membrane protein
VSLFTLLAGPQLALIGTALVVAILTALPGGCWANCGLNTLAMGALPVLVTAGALRATERCLPPKLFMYIFVVAFFGPGLAMFVTGLFASAAVVLGGAQPATVILMGANVGAIDRALRITVGLGILSLFFVVEGANHVVDLARPRAARYEV